MDVWLIARKRKQHSKELLLNITSPDMIGTFFIFKNGNYYPTAY